MRLHSCELRTPEPQRPPSLVIDLTMDSESADEEAAPSRTTQVSQPSPKPLAQSQQWLPPVGKFRLCKPLLSCPLSYMIVTCF